MVRRGIRDHDLAKAFNSTYITPMVGRLEIRPNGAPGACCAAHAAPAAETLAAVEAVCRQRGLRLTTQRRAVLESLVEAKLPLGAYDIIEALRGVNGRAPAPIAIYRALDFLREHGFIHRLETLNAFIACPHRHETGARLAFLICDRCRHVEEVVANGLNAALLALAGEHGFSAERQVVELAGRCRGCASADRG